MKEHWLRWNAMGTTKQYRSGLMASIHETAEGLHAAGAMGRGTLSEFDVLCLMPPDAPFTDSGTQETESI
jgi:putative transcriptional regulator